MKRFYTRKHQERRGAITILAAFLSIVLIAMVAFSVGIGYVVSAEEELQRSADSSALAACWEYGQRIVNGSNTTAAIGYARTTAAQYATQNQVTGHAMSVNSASDVQFGYISDFKNSASPFVTNSPNG